MGTKVHRPQPWITLVAGDEQPDWQINFRTDPHIQLKQKHCFFTEKLGIRTRGVNLCKFP